MATDSKDIELRVRARDYSTKTLEGVTKALDELQKSQDAQLASAKKGEASARELEASYRKIEDAVKALISQNNLVKLYEAQAKALEEAKKKADAARESQLAYSKSIEGIEQKTSAQVAALNKLATAVSQADKAQLRAQTNLDKTNAKLRDNGIAADELAAAQTRIAAGVAVGNAALERQQAALDTVEADTRKAAAARADAAKKEADAAQQQIAAQKALQQAADEAASRQQKIVANQLAVVKASFEQQKAQDALNAAMRKSADQAEAAAKGYATLARSITSVRGNELSAQLAAIADPARAANSNLDGLEASLGKLTEQVNAINGPVKDFRSTLAALDATMKGVGGIGAQIDAYKRQIDVLRAARTEYSQAQAAVRNLTTQMRAGGGDAAELGKQLTAAQAAVRNTASALSGQVSSTRALRDGLRAAGVDTRDLGSAEDKLVDQAKRAASAITTLSDAFKKHGAAADEAGKGVFRFFDNTRTTLSFTQRLKGELLALAAAYVGVQAAIDLAKGSLDAYNTSAKILSQLTIANSGDINKAAQDYSYLQKASASLGVSFKEAAPAFGKFAIAAKSANFTTDETRFIFEQLAVASRKAGLSASDFEGVLKAVEQMMSKGKVQAEELRGQLGDRLPGAFTFFAQSIGKSTEELNKMLEAGDVSARSLINFARTLSTEYKGASDQLQQLALAQTNYSNAVFEFQKLIADSGFADAYVKLLNKISDFLRSDEGTQLAQGIGKAFQGLVDIIIVLIDNFDKVKIAIEVIIALTFAKWLFGAYRGVVLLIESLGPLFTLLNQLAPILVTLGGALLSAGTSAEYAGSGFDALSKKIIATIALIPGLNALVGTMLLAKKAFDQLSASKNAATKEADPNARVTGTGGNRMRVDDIGMPRSALTKDPGGGFNQSDETAKKIADEAEKNQKALDRNLKAARLKSNKDELGERAVILNEKYDLQREAAKRDITDAKKLADTLALIDKQNRQELEIDRIKFDAEHAKAGAAAAKKEITLKEDIKNQLSKINDDLIKQETLLDKNSTFEERKKARLDAITHSYDKLKKTITQLSVLDKAGADEATKKLDAYIGQLQAVEAQKVTLDEVKKLEKELDDQMKLRQAGLDQEKAKYDAGLISQEEFLKNTAEINRRGDTAVTTAANNLQNFVDAAVKAKAGIISLTDQAEVKTKVTTATAGSSNTARKEAEALDKVQEEQIANLVAKRTAAENILKAQLDLRVISEDEYAKKANENADTYKAKIIESTQALIDRTQVRRDELAQEKNANPTQLAALDAQIARYKQLNVETKNALPTLDLMGKSIQNFITSGVDQGFDLLVQSLTDIASGAKSAGDAFRDLGIGVANFVAKFLLDIGKAIAKQLILNALANSGNPYLAGIAAVAGGVRQQHEGGRVGYGISGTRRKVDPVVFQGAQRFHEGGLPGLKPGEVPAILQTGEQVLSRDDPNNILNADRQVNVNSPASRFVLVDDRSGIPEAMQSAEGEKAILVALKRNSATVKQLAR